MTTILSVLWNGWLLLSPVCVCYIKRVLTVRSMFIILIVLWDGRLLLSPVYVYYKGCCFIRSISDILSVLWDSRLLFTLFYVFYIKRVVRWQAVAHISMSTVLSMWDDRLLLRPFYVCNIKRVVRWRFVAHAVLYLLYEACCESAGCCSVLPMPPIFSVLWDGELLLSPGCYIERVVTVHSMSAILIVLWDGRLLLSPTYVWYIKRVLRRQAVAQSVLCLLY